MPVQIIRNDITKMEVDVIVNAANRYLRGGSGVNGAIHKAAGPQLLEECMQLGGCETGEVKITGAYNLPCKYIIHTVGPVWHGGNFGEEELLRSCYRKSLELALKYQCRSIAFPLISSGVFGYPKEQALKVAMDAISSFLLKNEEEDLMVYLLVFNKECFKISSKLFCNIERFIDDHYVEAHTDKRRRYVQYSEEIFESAPIDMAKGIPAALDTLSVPDMPAASDVPAAFAAPTAPDVPEASDTPAAPAASHGPAAYAMPTAPVKSASCAQAKHSLEYELGQIDESFSEMVVRKIQEKGMKNSECYKKANIDKKLFSKIYNDIHYKPKKQTALALAVALELSIDETRELLMKAGLALSRSDKFDIIVEYFIRNKQYNIFEINETLFFYDQLLLGSTMN